ncbi:hypothetical protein A8C56_12835 [Niabella ginsenosidivorans]|uniref:DUF4199 domain-containing protein n=1 Tax=Niabella ginsenosidivorans TaxID=1176587 RepID=A0A1A9I255_9BACT|nr:DUF4199 domain-containing protein [Niabella ginsenosidivorans]ANH81747.1 hypothetical protein A8C56_12835 [Niabella ginsenosidivorans]
MTINATRKGFITGVLMVLLGLLLIWQKVPNTSGLQYLVFLLYGAGIVWAIYPAAQSGSWMFKGLFNQGFRCFVIVTLIMAVYTFIFFQFNKARIEKDIEVAKQERLKTAKDRTPAEIEQEAQTTRKFYIPLMVSQTIFQYLLIGVVVSTVTAGTLSLSRKK